MLVATTVRLQGKSGLTPWLENDDRRFRGPPRHAFHTLGSRVLGFSQELYDDSGELEGTPEVQQLMIRQMSQVYPNISAIMEQVIHDDASVVGSGCDDQWEFEFALDLILDGLEVRLTRDGQS